MARLDAPGLVLGMMLAACSGAAPSTSPRSSAASAAARNAATSSTGPCARRHSAGRPLTALAQSSGVALLTHESRTLALVADADQHAVHHIDLATRRSIALTPLPGAPEQLLILGDGRVAVTLRGANRIALLEPGERAESPLDLLCNTGVASDPFAIALDATRGALLVSSGFGRRLSALGRDTLEHRFSVELPREPRSVVVSPSGDRAFVSHAVGNQVSVVDLATGAPAVRAIDVRAAGPEGGLRSAMHGVALAGVEVAGGFRLLLPNVAVNPGRPVISLGYGGSLMVPTQIALVSVVDPDAERVLTPGVLPNITAPRQFDVPETHGAECLLPRAALIDGSRLLVGCLGIDSVVELDARGVLPNELELRRWRVAGGPTALALDSQRRELYVWSAFARELDVIDLSRDDSGPIARIGVARRAGLESAALELADRGRELFHRTFDPRVSRDGRACASCHPDGREDGLTWSTPEGPRQTLMLAGRVHPERRLSWRGNHPDLRTHLASTLEALGGTGFSGKRGERDLAALVAYVHGMKGPRPSERPAELVTRGRALFFDERNGCGACHLGGGSDDRTHDVGSGSFRERHQAFLTPSLLLVNGSAPYFHDGRYASLEELLERSDSKMGHTRRLSRADRDALIAYLESLGAAPDAPLPAGWRPASVLPSELPALEKPHPKSRAALFEAQHPRRLAVRGLNVDVPQLPLVETGGSVPAAVQRDLLVTRWKRDRARVSVAKRVYGVIQRWDSQPLLPRGGGGMDLGCGPATQGEVELSWETLAREPNGALRYENAATIFDRPSCTARVTRYLSAPAEPLIDGLLWGFRTTCAACAGETLHLILPPSGRRAGAPDLTFGSDEWITHLELPLGPGRAAAVALRISRWRPKSWAALGLPLPELERPLVGAQVANAVSARGPSLIVFAENAPDT